jgi:hypothetical protein
VTFCDRCDRELPAEAFEFLRLKDRLLEPVLCPDCELEVEYCSGCGRAIEAGYYLGHELGLCRVCWERTLGRD